VVYYEYVLGLVDCPLGRLSNLKRMKKVLSLLRVHLAKAIRKVE